ncbi:MAG: hypothetical protein V4864_13645 [Pseudomonadota bacterium]
MKKLGIDIGRVLIAPDPTGGGADTSFIGGSLEAALRTPPYEGMFDAVPLLVQLFGGQAWLVSKAGPRVQEKTRQWLQHHAFFQRTGIASGNIRFCLERSQKALHCRELGITHFIDDRSDVLGHLKGVVPHRFLFGPQKTPQSDRSIVAISRWDEARSRIEPTLAAA